MESPLLLLGGDYLKVVMMPLNYMQIKTKEDGKFLEKAAYSIIENAIKDSLWGNGDINDKQIKALIYMYLENPDPSQRGLFVAMDGSLYCGLLAAMVGGNSLTKQTNELMLNVLPVYREQGVATKLISMYEDWAKSLGIKQVTLSHYSDEIGSELSKFYLLNGYKPIEVTYMKEVE